MDSWPTTAREAIALQDRLRSRVEATDRLGPLVTAAGADLSHPAHSSRVHAAVVVLSLPGLEVVEVAVVEATVTFPYIPGLLAFREVPPILAAWARLARRPDLVVVDGHGYAHPRRFGVACHLGVALDVPTIGCAKTPFVGQPAGELPDEPGCAVPIVDAGETVAMALRTRRGSAPVYVSVGHRVSLETAVRLVRTFTTGVRIPEPTRQAHIHANAARRRAKDREELTDRQDREGDDPDCG